MIADERVAPDGAGLCISALHDGGNRPPTRCREVTASRVGILNACDDSLIGDEVRADTILAALETGRPEDSFPGAEPAMLRHAGTLAREPAAVTEDAEAHRYRNGEQAG